MKEFSLHSASTLYKSGRSELRRAEISLTDQREKVAALRRALPADTPVPLDYQFMEATDAAPKNVLLSELFTPSQEALVIIHYMWALPDEHPCSMCTMWADGYNAIQPHVSQHAPMVLVTKQTAERIRIFAASRGWRNLRTLSSSAGSFNRDFGMEGRDGNQLPGISVFLNSDPVPHHFYTGGAVMGDGHYRGIDLLSPVWNLLDLLPQGRGDWIPSLNYQSSKSKDDSDPGANQR